MSIFNGNIKLPQWRSTLLISMLMLILLVLIIRAYILTIGEESNLRSNIWIMSRSPESIQRLNTHLVTLQEMTSNIGQYNLNQIKEALSKTSTLAQQANIEFIAQQDSWNKVQLEIKKDKISFFEIQRQINEAQKIDVLELQ